jgi:hypothetical protein
MDVNMYSNVNSVKDNDISKEEYYEEQFFRKRKWDCMQKERSGKEKVYSQKHVRLSMQQKENSKK